jgi:hypothetical protein
MGIVLDDIGSGDQPTCHVDIMNAEIVKEGSSSGCDRRKWRRCEEKQVKIGRRGVRKKPGERKGGERKEVRRRNRRVPRKPVGGGGWSLLVMRRRPRAPISPFARAFLTLRKDSSNLLW